MGASTVDVLDVVDSVFAVIQLLQYLALFGAEVVAINKGVALGVVRLVYVDLLDLAKVVVAQQAQDVQVVAFDQQVAGSVPVLAIKLKRSHDFLHRYKSVVIRLTPAHTAKLVAVFFNLNACRVGRVNRQLHRSCIDADVTVGAHLNTLREVLAKHLQFLLVRGGGVQDRLKERP